MPAPNATDEAIAWTHAAAAVKPVDPLMVQTQYQSAGDEIAQNAPCP